MRNSVACTLFPEAQRNDSRGDATTLSFLGDTPTHWPEVPTATVRQNNILNCNRGAGSERNGFSLRTMIMITAVSVLLAAAGTATTICTLEDCRHIFSRKHSNYQNQSSPCDARWDRGGLASPSQSEVASEARGAGAANKPDTERLSGTEKAPSTSTPSPNAVEASLFAGGQPMPKQQASMQEMMESTSTGHGDTWQVVHNGFLMVRSDSCLYCKVIGMKDRCIMVRGQREGDWIRLLYEPGYMLAVANGSALLQRSAVSYSRIHMGTCAEKGLYPITDDTSCVAAALAIGFPDLAVQVIKETGKPEGCYMLGLTLWMSVNPKNKGQGVMGRRQPLCSSRPAPVADPCQKLPAKPSSPSPAASTQKQESSSHPGRHTLYCFSVIQPDSYEIKLMTVQLENSASIFKCDGSAILSVGRELKVGPKWRSIPVPGSSTPKAGDSNLIAELSMTYMRAWDVLLAKGTIWSYTWTAKVDSSAVFFPNRLLKRLESFLRSTDEPGEQLFAQSCDSKQGPSGSVAIYSREALRSYQKGNAHCKSKLSWQKWSNSLFMQNCFHLLGLNNKQDMEAIKSIFGTGPCHPTSCRDKSQVSFNGFKKARDYLSCFEQANEDDLDGLWKTDTVQA